MPRPDVVDLLPFHARAAVAGRIFRLLGYAGIVALLLQEGRAPGWLLPGLTLLLLAAWLVAWRMAVGALWRGSLVAALLTAFLQLSLRSGALA
jgi:hypothetical protein